MAEAKGGKARNRRTRHHAWMVVSAVMAGSLSGQAAFAQAGMPSLAQTATVQFDIRAQSLDAALIEFSRQSGVQVSAETSAIGGKQSAGVSGRMSPEQALTTLLSGTGLVFRRAGTMLVVQGQSSTGMGIVLDPVQVQGFAVPSQAMIDNVPPPYAGGQVATGSQLGLLGNRDVMDTPFNQTSYTNKKAQDQQAKTLKDIVADDPSIRSWRADGTPGYDAWSIRGFPSSNLGVSFGGLYGLLPNTSIMAELPERVEVLKGPSAMLNGMSPEGAIGGTINVVPKRAPSEGITQFTADYSSSSQFGVHADVGGRLGPENEFGVRANAVYRNGQTDVKWNDTEKALALLGLDYRGDRFRLSADLGYQYLLDGLVGYYGIANGVALPWAPNVRNNTAGQPWNFQQKKDLFGVVRAEVDLASGVTAYATFGAHDHRTSGIYSLGVTINGPNGAATQTQPFNLSRFSTYRTAEAGVRAVAATGPIDHQLSVIANTYEVDTGQAILRGGAATPTNIYAPTIVARPYITTPIANRISTSTLTSFGIADTLSAAEKKVQLTIGGRLQQVSSANFNPTTGAPTASYDQSAFSPSIALLAKPFGDTVSIYANWIQGLQQGTIVGSTFANAGEVFPPYKSNQFEVGVKVDWGKFTTTASAFQITQPSILTDVATNTQYLGGRQVNQGIEFNFFGEPLEGVRLLGGAMFLNPVLTETQGGLTNGWIAPLAPQVTLNLAAEWDVPYLRGLTLSSRYIYTGAQYFDTTFPRRSLPGWSRVDLGFRYGFENPGAKGKVIVARFNVENVLDANYWAGGEGPTGLMLGAPRTFRLALTTDF